ncbi:MAG: DNA replication/repair protein RecF [Clostridia bacterium]|nr:DNA replication/repair protein RecF [Clostridia bacterium]
MQVKKLICKNFKNILETELEFSQNMNVICGENAQGKTNIIEALWLFSGAKSFRNTKDNNFINFNCENASIYSEFIFEGVQKTAKIEFSDKKQAFINGKKTKNVSDLAECYKAIVFSPSDLSLVCDGPKERRKFLDVSIGCLYPKYIEILKNYSRAVIQRNQTIKEYKYDGSLSVMLDVFEKEIAENGEKIIKYRKKYIETLNNYLPEIYNNMSSGKEKIKTVYVANICDNIIEKLKESRKEDMYTGITSVGPHRDDISFFINGNDARTFGSQGQKRCVALSLKLSGANVLKEISGEYPVCLLDDVMSELDPKRQNYILNHIKDMQSFITCCDPLNTKGLKDGKIFKIKDGKLI